ncbi:MAG TPA: ABC transporter permease [Candidatus Acidoferrales bacterium]|nr:ABC transporter permease [Candidatus Acidoferrales bacterium]
MSLVPKLTGGVRALLHKREAEQELDEELRSYVETAAAEKMKAGMSREEAMRRVRMSMGSPEGVKEEVRSVGWETFAETLWQDVRYGARMLRKNPGFTLVAVLTLALGIGANTAIFSVVNAVLLRPLAFRDPGKLCLVTESLPSFPSLGPSYENYVDFRDQSKSLEGLAAVHIDRLNLTGQGDAQRLSAQMATASLFPLLGVNALEGRTFTEDEDRFGGPAVVMLSYGFWQSHFGGARDVLGKIVMLNDKPYTVSGILPPGFQIIVPVDVIVPFAPWAHGLPDDRNWHPGITAVGRLREGVTLEQARAEMATIAQRLAKQYPAFDTDMGANVDGLQDSLVQNVRPALLMLLGAVGLVLLIACGNIANLLLARAASRHREIAVRTALGAGRLRIVRQLLTESILLSFAGGALGLLLARLCMAPLLSLASKSLPSVGAIGLDGKVLTFTAIVALVAGILFGLAPALQTAKLDIRPALSDASRGSTGGASRHRMRNILVVTEVALALVLLIGAGLLIRSFERLQDVQPGFDASHLLVADVPASPNAYAQPAQRMGLFDQITERARTLPGVTSAGAALFLPVTGNGAVIHFNIQGRPPKTPHDYILIGYRPVSPDYLQTLRVPLLAGRMLNASDTERNAYVAVVNESMVKEYFPGQSPLGKHIQVGATPDNQIPWMEIVGVVGDMKRSLASEASAEMYIPYRQADTLIPIFAMSVVLRTANDPHAEVSALRSAVHDLDPNQPLVNFRTMQENIATSVSDPRFRTMLLGIFAASALLLSVIGLYGLMAYSVAQRTSEIGIRLALGAQRRDVLKLIVAQGLKLVLVGVAIGLGGALTLSRLLARFLYGVVPSDPATFAGVSVILTAVALVACWIPARRAMKVDPIVALRYE